MKAARQGSVPGTARAARRRSLPGVASAAAVAAALLACAQPVFAQAQGPSPDAIVERAFEHVVARGDSLALIAARNGVSARLLAADNALDPRRPLRPGQVVRVLARHVVPPPLEHGVVVNVPQRMVFQFRAGRLAGAYPAAVGRADWPTPTGEFRVINRQTDKTWIVPPSIQEEMRREGKPVLVEVPPGPENPLGRHWIGLSLPAIGLHGTNAPASVYGFRSHGCIRLHPDDVAELFDRTRVGERGRIVYLPWLLAQGGDGRIWFQANPDPYRTGGGADEQVRSMARERGIPEASIDWERVAAMAKARDGRAAEVGIAATRAPGTPEAQEKG